MPSAAGNYQIVLSAADQTAPATAIYPDSETIDVLGPPPGPAGFTTTLVSSSEVDLEWTATTTGLSGFVIQESDGSGGGWSQVAAVDAGTNDLAVPVTLATQGCYEFEIQSVNTLGVESAPATLAVLASPTLSAVSDTEVSVSWQLPSNVASYALQRSDDDGNTWTPVDTAGAVTTGGTTYVTDSGLSGGTSYEYQLTATLADTTAATSVAATVTTLQSAGNTLTATYVSGNEIDLAWQANYPTSEGFEVDESTDNGKTFNQVGTAAPGETSYVVSGPVNTSPVPQFRVQALDAGGKPHLPCVPVAVIIPSNLPGQPVGLAATSDSPYEVDLTWSDPTGDASGFIVERQDTGDTVWQDIGVTTGTSYTDYAVQGETSYTYCVVATNANGGSIPSNSAMVETGLLPPTSFDAFLNSSSQIMLDWATDPTTAEYAGYTVMESGSGVGNPSNWTQVADSSAVPEGTTATVISSTTLGSPAFVNGLTYYFAICKAGAGGRRPRRSATRCSFPFPACRPRRATCRRVGQEAIFN